MQTSFEVHVDLKPGYFLFPRVSKPMQLSLEMQSLPLANCVYEKLPCTPTTTNITICKTPTYKRGLMFQVALQLLSIIPGMPQK